MEVQITRRPNGCIFFFLGLLTLGLVPLLLRGREAVFVVRMDDNGVTTKGGKIIPWSDFKKAAYSKYRIRNGGTILEEYNFKTSKGSVNFFSNRMKNFDQAIDYVWTKIPHLNK